ncbi:hypothetical protein [Maritimibacter sp. DP1N21-5]|uniref:hypothetical protein n=1 Tax=Maritimibacter sp. DP1N21-5 TaxID=2836867 RepID=UPI001C4669BF|nr:hypothetical protein [Maritimibacter sp. DP1N21-5]MBV7408249.1 hypothetical protein [Maritimibacter sp. DP1N21-5]
MSILSRITRSASAAAIAAALALSPAAATPARAGDAELIAGAIGTVVLGAIALNAYNNAGQGNGVRVAPQPQRQQVHQPRRDHDYGRHSRTLPSACAIPIGRGHNQGLYFGKRCLSQNFSGARALPGYCETQMVDRQSGRVRNVYNGSCLQRAGYRVDGHGGGQYGGHYGGGRGNR